MSGRIMSRFAILLVVAIVATGLVRRACALQVYWTTDPQTAETAPPGGWDTAPPDTLTSQQGNVWLAAMNEADPLRRKYLHIKIKGTALQYFQTATLPYPEGFATTDTSTPVKAYDIPPIGGAAGNLSDLYWGFEQQPEWERVLLVRTNGSAVGGLQWDEVTFNSVCTDAEWSNPDIIDLLNASVDAPGAVIGNPRWKEFWIFPRIGAISAFPPLFIAPPSTGSWSSATVFTDPDGNPHPGGGVKFATGGGGLSVSDRFNVHVRITGGAPGIYDAYSYNATTAKYEKYRVQTGSLVPGASRWTLILAAMATLAAGALALRRRRVA